VVLFFFAVNYKGLKEPPIMIDSCCRFVVLSISFFKPPMDTDKHGYWNLFAFAFY